MSGFDVVTSIVLGVGLAAAVGFRVFVPLLSAAVIVDLPPLVEWITAIIAGGGTAAVTQSITALLRVKSTATTAGLGNPVVATAELGGSLLISVLAVALPVVALVAIVVLIVVLVRQRSKRRSAQSSR